jgi:hypothetical protein
LEIVGDVLVARVKVSEEKPAKERQGRCGDGFKMLSEGEDALDVVSASGEERFVEDFNQPSGLGVEIGSEHTEQWFGWGLHVGFVPVKAQPKIELHCGF